MTKQKNHEEVCYDLDAMTTTEEQRFWYEFESMLYRARDNNNLSLSRINIVNYHHFNVDGEDEMTLH